MERKMVTYEDIFVFVYTEGGGRRGGRGQSVGGGKGGGGGREEGENLLELSSSLKVFLHDYMRS